MQHCNYLNCKNKCVRPVWCWSGKPHRECVDWCPCCLYMSSSRCDFLNDIIVWSNGINIQQDWYLVTIILFLSRSTWPISHLVSPSVRPSVTLCFFCIFWHFKGRKVCIWAFPCPNQYCLCPNQYCPCPTHYCPCPTAHDRGSRVYGLVLFLCHYLFFFICMSILALCWPYAGTFTMFVISICPRTYKLNETFHRQHTTYPEPFRRKMCTGFLDAPSNLYKRVCPSVRRSVGPSVPRYFQTRTRCILCRVSGLVQVK